jgi:4-amino-4-deoxy-L-arabinose transferase-like glycosyltransferase
MDDSVSNPNAEVTLLKEQPFLSRTVIIALGMMALICLFYGISEYRSFVMHEVFAGSTARQMYLTGDHVVPYHAGHPRLRKPPLIYWMISGSAHLMGEFNEFSARLPSAVCAILLAALMGLWAGKWYGRSVGYLTAFVQATCYYVMLWSRKAEVDMCLTLLNVAALYLIATQPAHQTWKQGFLRWLMIFGLMGLSTLAKFYYGPAFVFAIAGVFWLIQGRWKDIVHTINPVGWILWLAPFGIWAWVVSTKLPNAWDVWQQETVGRALGVFGSTPLWFYVLDIPFITLPWTPLWLLELKNSWHRAWEEKDARERFLWVWFVVPFIVVTLQPDKHTNYAMTFVPVLSILAGRKLSAYLVPERWLKFQWSGRQAVSLTLLNLAGGVAAGVLILKQWPDAKGTAIFSVMVVGVGCAATVWLFRLQQQRAGVLTLLVCYTGFVMIFFGEIQPLRDPKRNEVAFNQQIREKFPKENLIGYKMDVVASYYLGPHYWDFSQRMSPDDFREQIAGQDSVIVVVKTDQVEELKQYGKITPIIVANKDNKGRKSRQPACWKLVPHQSLQLATQPNKTKRQ